jgi:hypothetical protein
MRHVPLIGVLLLASGALAQSMPEYQGGGHELDSWRSVGPDRIDFYDGYLPPPPEPFPWTMVWFTLAALTVALPIGIRHWRKLTRELETAQSFGRRHTTDEQA